MLLKINKVTKEDEFENKVAHLKAILIQEYINQLDVNFETKCKVRKEVIKKLSM